MNYSGGTRTFILLRIERTGLDMLVGVAAAVSLAECAEGGIAARIGAEECRAAGELVKDALTAWASYGHQLLYLPSRGEQSALRLPIAAVRLAVVMTQRMCAEAPQTLAAATHLGFGGELCFKGLLPCLELALHVHLRDRGRARAAVSASGGGRRLIVVVVVVTVVGGGVRGGVSGCVSVGVGVSGGGGGGGAAVVVV